jgi:Putative Actinobacterial Holin-X, holin superfamily III
MVDRVSRTSTEPLESLHASMRETMHEGVALLNAEMRLLLAETGSNLRNQVSAAIALIVAGVLGLIGLILLAVAAVWFLAAYLNNPGLAYLIVAIAVLFIALVIFVVARRKLSFDQLIPHRFLRTLNDMRFDLRVRRHG